MTYVGSRITHYCLSWIPELGVDKSNMKHNTNLPLSGHHLMQLILSGGGGHLLGDLSLRRTGTGAVVIDRYKYETMTLNLSTIIMHISTSYNNNYRKWRTFWAGSLLAAYAGDEVVVASMSQQWLLLSGWTAERACARSRSPCCTCTPGRRRKMQWNY
jgi:hypothetical protein